MIICSCNNISDTKPLIQFKYKCGKCKIMSEEINSSTILKTYKNFSLLHKEEDNKQIYYIYEGYIKLRTFESEDHSAYRYARDFFDSLRDL